MEGESRPVDDVGEDEGVVGELPDHVCVGEELDDHVVVGLLVGHVGQQGGQGVFILCESLQFLVVGLQQQRQAQHVVRRDIVAVVVAHYQSLVRHPHPQGDAAVVVGQHLPHCLHRGLLALRLGCGAVEEKSQAGQQTADAEE